MAKNKASGAPPSGRSRSAGWGTWVLRGMCALFLGLGIWTFFDDSAKINAERVAKLPAADTRRLHSWTKGTPVLLEGKIAAQATKAPEDFIAYRQESYLRTEKQGASAGKEQWQSVGTVK